VGAALTALLPLLPPLGLLLPEALLRCPAAPAASPGLLLAQLELELELSAEG
jgi:hypothetical protein